MLSPPIISIITVVYNDVEKLKSTIRSVECQSFSGIEHIIVDGGSMDGTVEYVRQYATAVNYAQKEKKLTVKWISEKDNGIYDAMNKGISLATGQYLWFINAGDEIYASNTLEQIFSKYPSEADVYYGETMLIDSYRRELGTRSALTTRKLPGQLHWRQLKMGMLVSHQAFIVKKTIAPQYDLRYRHCADIDWMIRCLKQSKCTVNTEMILSRFLIGGYSAKKRIASWIERFFIFQQHFGWAEACGAYIQIALRVLKFYLRKSIFQ